MHKGWNHFIEMALCLLKVLKRFGGGHIKILECYRVIGSSSEEERRTRMDMSRRTRSIWFVGTGLEGKMRRERDTKGRSRRGRRGWELL